MRKFKPITETAPKIAPKIGFYDYRHTEVIGTIMKMMINSEGLIGDILRSIAKPPYTRMMNDPVQLFNCLRNWAGGDAHRSVDTIENGIDPLVSIYNALVYDRTDVIDHISILFDYTDGHKGKRFQVVFNEKKQEYEYVGWDKDWRNNLNIDKTVLEHEQKYGQIFSANRKTNIY